MKFIRYFIFEDIEESSQVHLFLLANIKAP